MEKKELVCIRKMLCGTAVLLACILAFLTGTVLLDSTLLGFTAAVAGFVAAAYVIKCHLYFDEWNVPAEEQERQEEPKG